MSMMYFLLNFIDIFQKPLKATITKIFCVPLFTMYQSY